MNRYALLADALVTVHMLYVSFTVGGAVLILLGALFRWSWIRNRTFRIVHLLSILIVAAEAVLGAICPLTEWEYNLRKLAGQRVELKLSFVARLLRTIIFYDFPLWVFTITYLAFAGLIILTLIFIPPRWKKRKSL